jgi:hypothetical protein
MNDFKIGYVCLYPCTTEIVQSSPLFFQSFLKKEFSEENLIFWLACEKYKTLEAERQVGNLEVIFLTVCSRNCDYVSDMRDKMSKSNVRERTHVYFFHRRVFI